MLVKILKAFPYAADGINIRELAAGAMEEVHDGLVEGLRAAGFIATSTEDVQFSPEPMYEHMHAPAHDEHVHQPAWNEPSRDAEGRAVMDVTEASLPVADAYPHLSPAQEEALDNVNDGVTKPGGSPKGGNRKRRA